MVVVTQTALGLAQSATSQSVTQILPFNTRSSKHFEHVVPSVLH